MVIVVICSNCSLLPVINVNTFPLSFWSDAPNELTTIHSEICTGKLETVHEYV